MSLLDWASVLASLLNYHLDVYRQMFWPFTLLGSMHVHSDVCGQNVLTFLAVKFTVTADVYGPHVLPFDGIAHYCHADVYGQTILMFYFLTVIIVISRFIGQTFDLSGYWTSLSRWASQENRLNLLWHSVLFGWQLKLWSTFGHRRLTVWCTTSCYGKPQTTM